MADLDLAALRERLARIIEPEAWGDFDKMHGGGWRRENIAHAVVADSEEKAEAILAALSPLLDRLARAEADVGRLRALASGLIDLEEDAEHVYEPLSSRLLALVDTAKTLTETGHAS